MEITIGDAVRYSSDNGNYPDVIPVDYGLDLSLATKPEIIVSTRNPRKIKIEVSTFRGVATGAIHYYATIIADGVELIEHCDGGAVMHCGYICEEYSDICRKNRGKYEPIYKIEVMRELSKNEIDEDPIRWEGYSPGNRTNAFYTEKEAFDQAVKIAKLRFGKGWSLELENETITL